MMPFTRGARPINGEEMAEARHDWRLAASVPCCKLVDSLAHWGKHRIQFSDLWFDRDMMHGFGYLLSVALALTAATPVMAQDDAASRRATIEQVIRNHPAGADRAATMPIEAATLDYIPSPEVRRRNLERFVDAMRAQNRSNAAQLNAYFADNDVMAVIDRRMGWTGDTTPNVADALAVWWVGAWVVNQEPGRQGVSSDTMRIVRDQAAAVLLSSLKTGELSDAQKQEMAENYLLNTVVLQESFLNGRSDLTFVSELADEVQREALAQGIDLTAVTLTDQGFVLIDR